MKFESLTVTTTVSYLMKHTNYEDHYKQVGGTHPVVVLEGVVVGGAQVYHVLERGLPAVHAGSVPAHGLPARIPARPAAAAERPATTVALTPLFTFI